MNSLIWPKFTLFRGAIALAIGAVLVPLQSNAQNASDRTTLSRAAELVDDHLARAQRQEDLALRQRMSIEGYIAELSLPLDKEMHHAAKRLRDIDAGSWAIDITPDFLLDARWETIALAERHHDPSRVRQLLRALLDSDGAVDALRGYEFERLVDANKREAIAAFVVADESSIQDRLKTLCNKGKLDLAAYAAMQVTDPTWAEFAAGIMSEAGMVGEAEARASRGLTTIGSWKPDGLRILAKIAATESRRGHTDAVERLVRMVLNAANAQSIADEEGNFGRGPCEAGLWNEWPRWHARSMRWLSLPQPPFDGVDSSRKSLAAAFGEALAGAGPGPDSLKLVDRLIALVDREISAGRVGPPPNGKIEPEAFLLWVDRRNRLRKLEEARRSLMVARVAAGGDVDDEAVQALSVEAVSRFLMMYPHTGLALRILSFSKTERDRLHRNADLDATLQYVALMHEGRAKEARVVADAYPKAGEAADWRLLDIVAGLQNAGLQAKAVAMLDAYLELKPAYDTAVLHLLLVQGRTERAKAILRGFISSENDDHVFIGVMLLRELGDRLDVATLKSSLRGAPAEKVKNWLAAIDALAWSAANEDIDSLLRSPPIEVASLSEGEAEPIRCAAWGLQAIALARAGRLETAVELVRQRNLQQRTYGCKGHRGAFFDIRYLVQEWVERGHAN
jgi:hypothetical protein